jgi:Transport and Golgi organisation 2
MCTVVLLRRPQAPWPLLLAANRDELRSRPWRPPARHWPDRPDVVAGLDVLAGGSWLGVNDDGVVAAVLNRVGSLGPAAGKRSRGELVLEALDHADAAAAAKALADLDPDAYRPFNLVIADAKDAFWLRHAGGLPAFGYRSSGGVWREVDPASVPGAGSPRGGDRSKALHPAPIESRPLPQGCSMITARDLNDAGSARVRHY